MFVHAGGQVLISETSSEDGKPDDLKRENASNINGSLNLAECYVPIDSYEGKHRYDPEAEWTEQEEIVLIRRVWSRLQNFMSPLMRID